MVRTHIEDWAIKELCEGKTLAEINQFQQESEDLLELLEQLKIETRALGVFLLTGSGELFFSTEIDASKLKDNQIKAIKEARRIAMIDIQNFYAGQLILYSKTEYDPLGTNYSFPIDDQKFRSELMQLNLFDTYRPYQKEIIHSAKSVFLLLIYPYFSIYSDMKVEFLDQIKQKAKDIFFRIYFIVAEQQGQRGYLIKLKNEDYLPSMIKKDMEYLLDLYHKILKGELSIIP